MHVAGPLPDEVAVERGLAALVWDGIFAQTVGVLTGGALLTGCALEFGASPAVIGVLAAIPFFAQFAHVPAVILVEKLRRRRAICLIATLIARAMLLPLVALPFVPDPHLRLVLLLAAFAVMSPFGAMGGCAWLSWTCDLVPHERLGRVFGRRQWRSTLSGVTAGLVGGAIVSLWPHIAPNQRLGGYAIVFALALVAAMASSWCLARMPDVPMPPSRHQPLGALFGQPFRDGNFRRLMAFLGCWQFVANLALPFYPVYLVQHLHYSIMLAIVLGMVAQLASAAAVRFWAGLSDRSSNKTVIALCGPLFLCCPLGWVFAAQSLPGVLLLPALVGLQLLLGTATAGLDLACGNIALKLAPRREATVFLGANGLVKSLCAGCAPVIGGFILDRLAGGSAFVSWVEPWQVIFVLAALLGAIALARLPGIAERGHAPLARLFGFTSRPAVSRESLAPDAVARAEIERSEPVY